MLYVDVRLKS